MTACFPQSEPSAGYAENFCVICGWLGLSPSAILGGVAKDQPIEIGVVSQWVQVVIVLCTHTKGWFQVECSLQRLERQIDRTEPRASRGQSIMNVRRFRLARGSVRSI